MTVKIYRTVARRGSVISTELIAEVSASEATDLQDVAEQYGGDYAVADFEQNDWQEAICLNQN